MVTIFNKARGLEVSIEKFLKNIEVSTTLFEIGLLEYLDGKTEDFKDRCSRIQVMETECDNLRFDIKYTLYSNLLIPDARGDVLGLVETLDNVIDLTQKVYVQFVLEKPIIFPFLKDDFVKLTKYAVMAVHSLIPAVRAYFNDTSKVADHVNQVHIWEHEADQVEYRIKEKVFASDEIKEFSRKVHIRHFAEKISRLADESEAVAERLEVYAIKRAF